MIRLFQYDPDTGYPKGTLLSDESENPILKWPYIKISAEAFFLGKIVDLETNELVDSPIIIDDEEN